MGKTDEMRRDSPGKQLQSLLQELFPPDAPQQNTFAKRIDEALYADGELAKLLYNSTINYLVRRLINTAEFIKRKTEKSNQPEERFLVDLRIYLKEQVNIPESKIEQVHTLLRECLKARKRSVSEKRIKDLRKDAKRNNKKCYICGCDLDFSTTTLVVQGASKPYTHFRPEVEHIWPHSFGGLSEHPNIVISCSQCNRKKKDYIDYSDFHYEEISLICDEDDEHFANELTKSYQLALWSKNQFKCSICQKPASDVGKLLFKRKNPDDSWHFLNIDSYCEKHISFKRK